MSRRRTSTSASRPSRIPSDTVARLYRDAHGGFRDPRRFDRRPPRWRRWAIAGGLIGLVVLVLAAWASFLVFRPYSPNAQRDLAIVIEAPPAAVLGDAVTYRITVANDARVPVAAAELTVRLPDDFLLAAADPTPDDAHELRWTLGSIAGNDKRAVELRGHLYGTPEQPARITATAVYRPGNFNADFEEHTEALTALGASPIALTWEGPERVVPGEQATYHVTLAHVGTEATPPVRVTLDAPRAFTLASAEPARVSPHTLVWDLGPRSPGDPETVITLRGAFAVGAATPYTFRATATISPQNTRALTLATATGTTEVLGGAIMLVATANDQTTGFPTRPGDAIRIRIVARNDGDAPLRTVTARAVFEATSVTEKSILNFSAMTDPANGTAVGEQLAAGQRRGTVTWTSEQIPALAEITPGAQQTIDATVPIHTAASLPGIPDHATITFHAELTVGAIGDSTTPLTITTTPITMTVQ